MTSITDLSDVAAALPAVVPELSEDELVFWMHTFLSRGVYSVTDGVRIYVQTLNMVHCGNGLLCHTDTYGIHDALCRIQIRINNAHMVERLVGHSDRHRDDPLRVTLVMDNGVTVVRIWGETCREFVVVEYYNESFRSRNLIQYNGPIMRCRSTLFETADFGPVPIPQHCRLIGELDPANHWLHRFASTHEIIDEQEAMPVAERSALYEILGWGCLRPYLDLDHMSKEQLDDLPAYAERVKNAFVLGYGIEPRVLTLRSNQPNKDGYWTAHLVVLTDKCSPPMLFRTGTAMRKFFVEAGVIAKDTKSEEPGKIWGDRLVYSQNQKMRLMNAPKQKGATRVFESVGDAHDTTFDGSLIVRYGVGPDVVYFDQDAGFDFGAKYARGANAVTVSDETFTKRIAEFTALFDTAPSYTGNSLCKLFARACKHLENSPRSYRAYYALYRRIVEITGGLSAPGVAPGGGSNLVDPILYWNCAKADSRRPTPNVAAAFMSGSVHTATNVHANLDFSLNDWTSAEIRTICKSRTTAWYVHAHHDILHANVIEALAYPNNGIGKNVRISIFDGARTYAMSGERMRVVMQRFESGKRIDIQWSYIMNDVMSVASYSVNDTALVVKIAIE